MANGEVPTGATREGPMVQAEHSRHDASMRMSTMASDATREGLMVQAVRGRHGAPTRMSTMAPSTQPCLQERVRLEDKTSYGVQTPRCPSTLAHPNVPQRPG